MDYALFFAASAAASTLAGMVGVGGALLIVPMLMAFAGELGLVPPEIRFMGYLMNFISLAPIVVRNRAKIDWKMAMPLIVAAVAGAVIGANLPKAASEKTLLMVFAITLIIIIGLLVRKIFDKTRPVRDFQHDAKSWAVIAGIGLIVGLASGLFGIGGGIFMLPLVVIFLGIKPKSIILITPLIVLFSTGTGILVHLLHGLAGFHLGITSVVAAGAIIGANTGDHLRGRLSDKALNWVIVLVLAAMTVKIWLRVLGA